MIQTNNRQFQLSNEFLVSKAAMERRARAILSSYGHNERLKAEDEAFMVGLLRMHKRAAIKVGAGVAEVRVRFNPKFKTRSFWVVRTDGTETDFSYLKAIRQPSSRTKFSNACRGLVSEDILSFKKRYFADHGDENGLIQCPVSLAYSDFSMSQVDHIPPDTFASILNRFIHEFRIDVEKVELVEDRIGCKFADERLANQWVAFHNEHAKLRVISRFANLILVPRSQRASAGQVGA